MAKTNYGEELGWEIDVDFPSWGNTEIYVKTISKGYLLPGENPKMLIGELQQELHNDWVNHN